MKTLITVLFTVFAFVFNANAQCGPEPTINFNQNAFTICPGNSATIIATPSGTVGPVSYVWTPTGPVGNSNTNTVSPTANSTWYYLEITDDCFTVIDSVIVNVDNAAITNINPIFASNCPSQTGSLGSISILPNNPIWTYSLHAGGTTYGPTNNGNFTNLPGGQTYFINIMTSNGCQLDSNAIVGLAANPASANFITDSLRNVTCFGDTDGGAYITNITGGLSSPYDVYWTHESGTFLSNTGISNLGDAEQDFMYGGQWVVSAVDQDGCAWSHLFEIGEPDEITIDWITNSPVCYGHCDGSATVSTTGGNGGNNYQLYDANSNQINAPNQPTINLLCEGFYYALVTDNEGCSLYDSTFIDQPDSLHFTVTTVNTLCSYDSGWAKIDTVYNFQGSYNQISYFWIPNPSSVPNGIGSDSINNLLAGNYSVIINDANGCSASRNYTINSPSPLSFSSLSSTNCTGNNDGAVSTSAIGGVGSYTYTWTNLSDMTTSNNSTWGGLGPGDYQIEVIDANGCLLTAIITVGCVGINENELSLSLYPNPAVESVYLNFSKSHSTSITITDLLGKICKTETLSTSALIDVRELEPGHYLVSFIYQGEKQTLPLVISRD